MSEIITGLLCKISDGDQVRTYLLTTAPYHDPALAAQIEYGTALPVIPEEAGLSISEQISFQPQGGSNNVGIGQIPLLNSEGHFNDWGGWILSGLEQTLARGYVDQPFSEWPLRFDLRGRGKPEFVGRKRVLISLRDRFAYMAEPVADQVFTEDDVENDRLINTTVPMVFGSAYQVDPLLTQPNILRYAVGSNVNDVPAVQEGGNPSTPVFGFVPLGFQLVQSPTLKITCDVTGPPIEGWEEQDALAGIGGFSDWTDDLPDGWDVTEDAPWSVISETAGGDARVEATARIEGDTGWITGTSYTTGESDLGPNALPVPDTSTLAEVLDADDGEYAKMQGPTYTVLELEGTGFDFALTPDVGPTGIEARAIIETAGGGGPAIVNFGVRFPDGTTRTIAENIDIPGTKTTLDFGDPEHLPFGVTKEILEDPEFGLVFWIRNTAVSPTGPLDVRVHQLALRVSYGPLVDNLRLTSAADVLTPGNRYLLRITTLGAEGDSIRAFWGGVSSHSAKIPGADSPYAQTNAQLEGEDQFEFSFQAQGPRFSIEFDRGDGNGEQTIERIECLDKSASRERYTELMRYLHETADRDPDEVCDTDSFDRVQTAAANPRLGWYVSDQTTREQLAVLLSHSVGATCWGGVDGKYHAAQMRVPQQPDGDYLALDGAFAAGHARPDTGEDLRDRVFAARNVHPLRDSETADVTTTWQGEQRQQVITDWRITEKADWSNLVGFPTFTLTGIDPSTGDTEGGTTVTLTGTGLSAFDSGAGDTIIFGDNAATNINVVSDTEITCDTPAGTAGSVDVTVTVGSESRSLAFEYVSSGGGGGWTPADLTDLLIWHHTRDPVNYTLDAGDGVQWDDLSGNADHAAQATSSDRPALTSDAIGGLPAFNFVGSAHFDSPLDDSHGEYVVFAFIDADNDSALREYLFTVGSLSMAIAHIGSGGGPASYNGSWQEYGTAQSGVQSLLFKLEAGTDVAEAFRNGESIGTATWSSTAISSSVVAIGNRPSSNQVLNGRMGEFIIARAPISQDDIDKIVGYAHHAWNRADLLPAGHPYKSSPP